jgi:hypothetical protein
MDHKLFLNIFTSIIASINLMAKQYVIRQNYLLLQQSFMGLLERNAGCVFRLGLWVAHEEK